MYNDPVTFLTLPAEIRNVIYSHVFAPTPTPCGFARHDPKKDVNMSSATSPYSPPASPSLGLVNRQISAETQLLHLTHTSFVLSSKSSDPDIFARKFANLCTAQQRTAIRSLTLRASIGQLRAMNERWDALPFGCADLRLETLTVVPVRPQTYAPHAEVADLSQVHTLAYLLGEAIKSLKNVETIVLVNQGCFTELLWRLLYRSLIFRMWKWAGEGLTDCSLGFREVDGDSRFEIRLGNGAQDEQWRDATHELERLTGVDVDKASDAGDRTPFQV